MRDGGHEGALGGAEDELRRLLLLLLLLVHGNWRTLAGQLGRVRPIWRVGSSQRVSDRVVAHLLSRAHLLRRGLLVARGRLAGGSGGRRLLVGGLRAARRASPPRAEVVAVDGRNALALDPAAGCARWRRLADRSQRGQQDGGRRALGRGSGGRLLVGAIICAA